MRVVRDEGASARLKIAVPRRRRWMRVVEGPPARPDRSITVTRSPAGTRSVSVPLDTSRRGIYPLGPYSLVHGDPWSIVRRVVHETETGTVTVLPRMFPVNRRKLQTASVDDLSISSRLPGDDHFHALRDYVLGDEPRSVHWRSSARVGHLVVRQQVASATSGTTVVLDCDVTAYGQDDQFHVGWESDRFEAGVEVAASIIAADLSRNEEVHLLRTTRNSSPVSSTRGSPGAYLDVLATVEPSPPVDIDAAGLPRLVQRTRCARAILVTGTPHPALVDAARRLRGSGMGVTVVRVATAKQYGYDGLDVIDIRDATDLATQPT
jgi:uncharacterized protein (DUF58 family)